MSPTGNEIVAQLIQHALEARVDRAPQAALCWLQGALAAEQVALWLLDRRHELLHRAAASSADAGHLAPATPLSVASSRAGAALQRDAVLHHRSGRDVVTVVPVSAFGDAAGVVTVHTVANTAISTSPAPDGAPGAASTVLVAADRDPSGSDWEESDWRALGAALALLVERADAATDRWELARRSHDYSVAAELQWQLMPRAGVSTPQVRLAALLEPAPQISSDLFDWSLNGSRLAITLLEASGRGIPAAQAGDLALAALRNARRVGCPLAEQAALADQAMWSRYTGHAVVRALLLELDLDAGAAVAVDAGCPYALRRRGSDVKQLDLAAHEPLGLLDRTRYRSRAVDVQPGDDLLVVSDGVPTARDGRGEIYGLQRPARRLRDTTSPHHLPAQVITELRAHVGGDLADDATVLALRWHPR